MTRWSSESQRLPEDHGWTASPGCKVALLDRGAARFDIPQDWAVNPGSDSIRITDRQPPDDDILMQASLIRLPPGIDWSAFPPAALLADVLRDDPRRLTLHGEVVHEWRRGLELALAEARFVDPVEGREAHSRACFARNAGIQAFITLDYWPEDVKRATRAWRTALRTLRVGEYVDLSGRPSDPHA